MIADIPWDLEKLKETPQAAWLNRRGTVHSLLYESEPFKGDRATEVFAYYASPGTLNADPKLDQNLPAIVLGHGGGGTAFDQWGEKWAAAGYAAIAMGHSNIFHAMDASRDQHWCYHGVANVIRAHSLIRRFPEVDAERAAITGISWGGLLACIVSGLDDRFEAVIPVYGCGYIYNNSPWLAEFGAMTDEHRDQWIKMYDPSQYLGYFVALPCFSLMAPMISLICQICMISLIDWLKATVIFKLLLRWGMGTSKGGHLKKLRCLFHNT